MIVKTYREVAAAFNVAYSTVQKEWSKSGMPGTVGHWDLEEIAKWRSERTKRRYPDPIAPAWSRSAELLRLRSKLKRASDVPQLVEVVEVIDELITFVAMLHGSSMGLGEAAQLLVRADHSLRTLDDVALAFGVSRQTVDSWRGLGMPGTQGNWNILEIAKWRNGRTQRQRRKMAATWKRELRTLGQVAAAQLEELTNGNSQEHAT